MEAALSNIDPTGPTWNLGVELEDPSGRVLSRERLLVRTNERFEIRARRNALIVVPGEPGFYLDADGVLRAEEGPGLDVEGSEVLQPTSTAAARLRSEEPMPWLGALLHLTVTRGRTPEEVPVDDAIQVFVHGALYDRFELGVGEQLIIGGSRICDVWIPVRNMGRQHVGIVRDARGFITAEAFDSAFYVLHEGTCERRTQAAAEGELRMLVADTEVLIRGPRPAARRNEPDRLLAVYLDGALVGRFEPDVRVIVGRSRISHVVVNSVKVARQHFTLELDEEGRILAIDLGSACGFWVGGRKCPKGTFHDEVEIVIADHILVAQVERRRSR